LLARTGHDPVADSRTDSADDRLAAEAAARSLAGALARLRGRPARPAALRLGRLGYQEIAEALGIPAWGVVDKPGAPLSTREGLLVSRRATFVVVPAALGCHVRGPGPQRALHARPRTPGPGGAGP
jgi:hypothetical protein